MENNEFIDFAKLNFTASYNQISQDLLNQVPEILKKKFDDPKFKPLRDRKTIVIDTFGLSKPVIAEEVAFFARIQEYKTPLNEKELLSMMHRAMLHIELRFSSILNTELVQLVLGPYSVFNRYFDFISSCNIKKIEKLDYVLTLIKNILMILISKMKENFEYQIYAMIILEGVYKLYNLYEFKGSSHKLFKVSHDFIETFFKNPNKNTTDAFLTQFTNMLSLSSDTRSQDENVLISQNLIYSFYRYPLDAMITESWSDMINYAYSQILSANTDQIRFDSDFFETNFNIWQCFFQTIQFELDLKIPSTNYQIEKINLEKYIKDHQDYILDTTNKYRINEIANKLLPNFIEFCKVFQLNTYIDKFIKNSEKMSDLEYNRAALVMSFILSSELQNNFFFAPTVNLQSFVSKKVFGKKYSLEVRDSILRLLLKFYFNPQSHVPSAISALLDDESMFYHFYPLFLHFMTQPLAKFSRFVKNSQEIISKLAVYALTNDFIYDFLRYLIYKFPRDTIPITVFKDTGREYVIVQLLEKRMLYHPDTFIEIIAKSYAVDFYLSNTIIKALECPDIEITKNMLILIGNAASLDLGFDKNELLKMLISQAKLYDLHIEVISVLTELVSSSSVYSNFIVKQEPHLFFDLIKCSTSIDLVNPLIGLCLGDINADKINEDSTPIIQFPTGIKLLLKRAKIAGKELIISKKLVKLGQHRANAEKMLLEGAYKFALSNIKKCKENDELLKSSIDLIKLLFQSQFTTSMFQQLIQTLQANDFRFADLIFQILLELIYWSELSQDMWSFVMSQKDSGIWDNKVMIQQMTTIAFRIRITNMVIDVNTPFKDPLFSITKNNKTLNIMLKRVDKEGNCELYVIIGRETTKLNFSQNCIKIGSWMSFIIIFNLPALTIKIDSETQTINVPLDENNEECSISFATLQNAASLDCMISAISITQDLEIHDFIENFKEPLQTPQFYRKYSPRCVSGNTIQFIDYENNSLTAKIVGTVSAKQSNIIDILKNADHLYSLVPVMRKFCNREDSNSSNANVGVILLKIFRIMFDMDDKLCTEFVRKDYFKYFGSSLIKLNMEFITEDFLNEAVNLLNTQLHDKVAAAFFLNIDFAILMKDIPSFIENYSIRAYNKMPTAFHQRELVMIYYGGALEKDIKPCIDFAEMIIKDNLFNVDKSFVFIYPLWYNLSLSKLKDLMAKVDLYEFISANIYECFLPWLLMLGSSDSKIQEFGMDNFLMQFINHEMQNDVNEFDMRKITTLAMMNFANSQGEFNISFIEELVKHHHTIPLLLRIIAFKMTPEESINWLKNKLKNIEIRQTFAACENWQFFLVYYMFSIDLVDVDILTTIVSCDLSGLPKLFRSIELFVINTKDKDNWQEIEVQILKKIPRNIIHKDVISYLVCIAPLCLYQIFLFTKSKAPMIPGQFNNYIEYLYQNPTVTIKKQATKDKELLEYALSTVDLAVDKKMEIFGVEFNVLLVYIDLLDEYAKIADDDQMSVYLDKISTKVLEAPKEIQTQAVSNINKIISGKLHEDLENIHDVNVRPVSSFYASFGETFPSKFEHELILFRSSLHLNIEGCINEKKSKLATGEDALFRTCIPSSYKHYYSDYLVSKSDRGQEYHGNSMAEIEHYFKTNGSLWSDKSIKSSFGVSSYVNRKGGRTLMEIGNKDKTSTHFLNSDSIFPLARHYSSIDYMQNALAISIKGIFSGVARADGNYVRFEGTTMTNIQFYVDIRITEIEFIFERKYLGKDIACEIFSSFNAPLFLVFPTGGERDEFMNIVSMKWHCNNSEKIEEKGRIPEIRGKFDLLTELRSINDGIVNNRSKHDLMKTVSETGIQDRWANGEITTFCYLAALNVLSGRSFNNLTCYPFFPWIFQDFDKLELRDLSRANMSDERAEDFRTSTVPLGFGYSNPPDIVIHMVRTQPFYRIQLDYQKHLEYKGRSFTRIKMSSSSDRHTECLEEMFSFPYFLVDTLKKPIWKDENGEGVADVELPIWAQIQDKNETSSMRAAVKFISLHKLLLETHASKDIHKWFDIMYGVERGNKNLGEFINIDDKNANEDSFKLIYSPPEKLFNAAHKKRTIKDEKIDLSEKDLTNKIVYYNKKFAITENGQAFYNNNTFDGMLMNRNIVGVCPSLDIIIYMNEKNTTINESFVIIQSISSHSLKFICHKSSLITAAAVAGERLLITGGNHGDINVWSLPGQAFIRGFSFHLSPIQKIAMSVDCGLICSIDIENNLVLSSIESGFISTLSGVDASKGLFVYKSGNVVAVGNSIITVLDSIGELICTINCGDVISAKKSVFHGCVECISVGIRNDYELFIKVFRLTGEEIESLRQHSLESVDMFDINKTGTLMTIVNGTKISKVSLQPELFNV